MWRVMGAGLLAAGPPLFAATWSAEADACSGSTSASSTASCRERAGPAKDHSLLQLAHGGGASSLATTREGLKQRSAAAVVVAPCAAFGRGIGHVADCSKALSSYDAGSLGGRGGARREGEGLITWICEVPDIGLALCDEERSMLSLWSKNTSAFTEVDLAPLASPVGAVYSEGKVYVACFGSGGLAGLAVVDPLLGVLEAAYEYPRGDQFVHNVYAFDWGGKPEIFVAALGNPWSSPPVQGDGLVRFDRGAGAFLRHTTAGVGLHVRSAVQQSAEVFFALTQEPPGRPSRLIRLERANDTLVPRAAEELPDRDGGDGGADVLLGRQSDTVFCTDRTAGAGKLYFYSYADGRFQLEKQRETGRHPRYSTILPNGDLVACNKHDATLTIFEGLAADPMNSSISAATVPTVPEVSFFIQSRFMPA